MKVDLSKKTALVCGASDGIGRACALSFAECGATVILFARNAEKLRTVHAELPGSGHRYIVADFDSQTNVQSTMNQVLLDTEIQIVVNNSGGPPAGKIETASSDDFILAMNRLLLNAHHITTSCLSAMRKANYGRVINIISTSVRQPIDNLGVSNTIRAATAAWAKTLSREVAAEGITVNNILPGATETSRLRQLIRQTAQKQGTSEQEVTQSFLKEIPAARFGLAQEIAYAATFLASEYASYITGTSLVVDGGRTKAL